MFWKGKKDKKTGYGHFQEHNGLATFLGEKINKLQTGWAKWMYNRAIKLKPRKLKLLLLLFVIGSSLLSVKFFVDGMNNQHLQVQKTGNIKIPKIISSEITKSKMDTIALKRIRKFRIYMDSLEKTSSNGMYDSILKHRPELMDSLRKFEELYYPLQPRK